MFCSGDFKYEVLESTVSNRSRCLSIHLFNKHILSFCYIPNTLLDDENIASEQTKPISCPPSTHILGGETSMYCIYLIWRHASSHIFRFLKMKHILQFLAAYNYNLSQTVVTESFSYVNLVVSVYNYEHKWIMCIVGAILMEFKYYLKCLQKKVFLYGWKRKIIV